MNKEENNFDEFLRAKLENHTVEVSDSVWAGIEKKQKKREKFIWFKQHLNVFLALDILLVLGFCTFTFLNTNDVQSKNNIASITTITPTIKTDTEASISSAETNQNNKQINIKNSTQTASPDHNQIASNNITSSAIKPIEKKDIHHQPKSIVPTEKKMPSQKTKVAMAIINQPFHNEIITESDESNAIVYASLSKLSLHPIFNEKNYQYNIIEDRQEINYLPASISKSKSKKVLNAEIKASEKLNKALKKQQNILANNEKSNEKIETEKSEQLENANGLLDETNLNDNVPLALDTVYGKKKFNGYIAIDALISPELVGNMLKGNNMLAQNYIHRRDSAENLRVGYGAQLRVNLFVNRNLFINSGISFSQRREKFSMIHKWETHEDYIDSSKFVSYVDPFAGTIIYKTYDTLDYVRTHKDTSYHNLLMSFVDVPVMIGYKWLGKRAGIAVQAGAIFNLLFKQNGTFSYYDYAGNDAHVSRQNPFNAKAGISLAGGISTNYKLTDKLDLLIEPHTRYSLKSINIKEYAVQQKLFSYGINFGLRLKL